ncbi:hypothetical protein [Halochromatium glycolicum]|uniref:Uncharacterized protein n=1 Tax=Halochromatium glycolicum TaxID=85075 RepID=A0AAJ0XAD4_9GAMM|nr:hypothetical protein [Halochromatium glycolicum]MBK1705666.1 hypothetical protein [Halochromatium glycolicum]
MPKDQFHQLHIDVARNATDDFNPFHDPHRWQNIRDNPYGGPIVLGFQLESLADYRIEQQHASESGLDVVPLPFSNYEFHFASALSPEEPFTVQVGRTQRKRDKAAGRTNRVVMRRADGRPIILGNRRDGLEPRFLPDWNPVDPSQLQGASDRSFLSDGGLFLKRKYLNTSNGKNFLLGSLVDQYHYFDELDERVSFPPVFVASLISCALLERGRAEGCDFEDDPHVYASHRISIDRRLQGALRSNNRVDVVVAAPTSRSGQPVNTAHPGEDAALLCHRCIMFTAGGEALLRCEVQTARLRDLMHDEEKNGASTE